MELTPWLAHYKTEFERARRERRDSIELDNLRCEALDRFLLQGFPTARDPGWQGTDLTAISETYFTMAAAPGGSTSSPPVPGEPTLERLGLDLTFVNGYYVPELSSPGAPPDGALVSALSPSLASNADDLEPYLARAAPIGGLAFVALNTAFFHDGACVVLPADTALDAPVHLRFVSTGDADMKPAMSHPRVLVVLNDGSRATIVESHTGPDGIEYFTNAVTEIVLGEHAFVDYYRLQHESTSAYHVGSTYVLAGRDAECSMHRLSLGAALVRDDLATLLGAERGACTIDALSLAGGRQTFDAHTIVDHAMPECSSRQRCKGILGGEARGVLGSRNIVRASAPRSRGRQLTQALVLSRDARAIAKPEVELLAQDARFIQRAVISQIDAHQLSRESSPDAGGSARASALAFARRALNRVRVPPVKRFVEKLLERRLDRLFGISPASTQ